MDSYKKAEIIETLLAASSNEGTLIASLSHLFNEKKVRSLYNQPFIFQIVLQQIGFESFLELIIETIDILNQGSPKYLHSKTQELVKKTPGGVFMSLFKNSEKVEPEKKKLVLKELKKDDKNKKRKYKGLLGLMSHLTL